MWIRLFEWPHRISEFLLNSCEQHSFFSGCRVHPLVTELNRLSETITWYSNFKPIFVLALIYLVRCWMPRPGDNSVRRARCTLINLVCAQQQSSSTFSFVKHSCFSHVFQKVLICPLDPKTTSRTTSPYALRMRVLRGDLHGRLRMRRRQLSRGVPEAGAPWRLICVVCRD